MIDKALGFNSPQRESYYFMLMVTKITTQDPSVKGSQQNFKFLLYKGS